MGHKWYAVPLDSSPNAGYYVSIAWRKGWESSDLTHTIGNLLLAIWLTASLVVCPYLCAHFPRSCGSSGAAADCGCHGEACCTSGGNAEPSAERTLPLSEEPCSCPCVCKGALVQCSAQHGPGEMDSAQPVIFAGGDSDLVLLHSLGSIQPEPHPPKILSGRQILAQICTLRL